MRIRQMRFEQAQGPAGSQHTAAAMLIVAQPGTAEITRYQGEMSQAHGAFVAFKGTPGQSFPPLVIKLTQMKQ